MMMDGLVKMDSGKKNRKTCWGGFAVLARLSLGIVVQIVIHGDGMHAFRDGFVTVDGMILGVDMIGVRIRRLIESWWLVLISFPMLEKDIPVIEGDTITGGSAINNSKVERAVQDG